MALPANEPFTGSDATAVASLANWTNVDDPGYEIVSNQAKPNSGTYSADRWSADIFNDDQYAEASVTALAANAYCGVAVRCASDAATYYAWSSNSNDGAYFEKVIADSTWALAAKSTVWDVNDVCRLEASGTTITPLINGAEKDPPGAVTDGSISSGWAGIGGYGDDASYIDNWEGGNLAAGGGVIGQFASVAWANVGQIAGVAEASIAAVAGVKAN